MRVLFVVHDFLPEHVGGTEVHTFELARALARLGVEPVIACTERDPRRAEGDVLRRDYDGIPVLELCHLREGASSERSFEEPRSRAAFARLLASERPDVVHVQHFAHWGTGVLEEARAARVPALATLHDFHLLCADATLLRRDGTLCAGECGDCLAPRGPARPASPVNLVNPAPPAPKRDEDRLAALAAARGELHRRHLASLSAVVVPSRFLAEFVASRGLVARERIVRIDSGVTGPWREPRASDPARPLRVGYVGGIYASKGVHVLIEALARLPRESATLDVHGVLEWFPEYVDDLVRRAGGREGGHVDVRWHGRFAPEALDGILDRLDVIVVPSLWHENRPLVMQAAFRRGVAVVATDAGGMAELCEHGRFGALFPRGDGAALARILLELARDRGKLLALARARPRLPSIDDVARRHLELYARAGAGFFSANP